jgi:hypothetical protein
MRLRVTLYANGTELGQRVVEPAATGYRGSHDFLLWLAREAYIHGEIEATIGREDT